MLNKQRHITPGLAGFRPLERLALPIFAVLLLLLPQQGIAQEVMRIAAVVNNDIITLHDVKARMKIVFVSTGLRPTKSMQRRVGRRVLRTLIDEKLQLQEAKKRNIAATKSDFKRAVATLEQNNRLPPRTFPQFLKRQGIDWDAMKQQIEAQILWSKLISRVLRPQIIIGDEEIDEKLEQLKTQKGSREFRVSEILLSANNQQSKATARKNAERLLRDIKQGARFEALARQFSDSTSASIGGDLGWLQEETLPRGYRSVVPTMSVGDVAGPIETIGGYYIVRLNEARRILSGSPLDAEVDLRRLLFDLPPGSAPADVRSQMELAALIGETISGCSDFDRAAAEAGYKDKTAMGSVKLADLAPVVRTAVKDVGVGETSAPVRIGNRIALFMVCKRKEPDSGMPSRSQIREGLLRERLDILSRRYMRDLRASAVVDLRA